MSVIQKISDMFYNYNAPAKPEKEDDKTDSINDLEDISIIHTLVAEMYDNPWDPSILELKETDTNNILDQKLELARKHFYKINLICNYLSHNIQDDISDYGKKFSDVKIDNSVTVKVPADLTPLCVLASHGNPLVNQLLSKVLAQANVQNKLADLNIDTRMALLSAVKVGNNVGIVELVRIGADVNIKDEHGFTALHYACVNKNEDVVRCLILCEADASMVDDAVKAELIECIESSVQELADDKAYYNLNTRDLEWLAAGASAPKLRP